MGPYYSIFYNVNVTETIYQCLFMLVYIYYFYWLHSTTLWMYYYLYEQYSLSCIDNYFGYFQVMIIINNKNNIFAYTLK